MCATALISVASSCSKNEAPEASATETVTFSTMLPGKTTRSFADGKAATTLTCYVYDSNNNFVLKQEGNMANKNGSVSVTLAKGVNYKIVFWADTDDAKTPYSITDKGVLTVSYEKMAANSNDNDAFYGVINFLGGSEASKTVELFRPLAQINIGTDDLKETAVTAHYGANLYTSVTATECYTTMNIIDGTVSNPTTVTTPKGLVSDMKSETFPVTHTESTKSYGYATMMYALVPTQGATSLITFNSYASNAADAKAVVSRQVPNAPLKQNFRTNLFGTLLSASTDFELNINPAFKDPTPEDGNHNLPQ